MSGEVTNEVEKKAEFRGIDSVAFVECSIGSASRPETTKLLSRSASWEDVPSDEDHNRSDEEEDEEERWRFSCFLLATEEGNSSRR